MIKSQELKFKHGFFGRQGGVSGGIYKSLNCGSGSGDNPAHIAENRKIILQKLGAENASLCTLYQIHSNKVVVIEEPFNPPPQADAIVTKTAGITLGILTADCAPVLFSDETSGVIGAAHCGWKGAKIGIVENTVEAMIANGAKRESIKAAIGPCIGLDSYQVGLEFKEQFVVDDKNNERFFILSEKEGKPMFNLPEYVKSRLENAKINVIDSLSLDTMSNEKEFFSYRRTTIAGEKDYGRQISVITLTL